MKNEKMILCVLWHLCLQICVLQEQVIQKLFLVFLNMLFTIHSKLTALKLSGKQFFYYSNFRQDCVAFMSQPYWVEVTIDIEVRLSLSLVENESRLSWDKLTLNQERNWAFIGLGLWFKICLRSTYVAEQHIFSMSPSILAFNFIIFKGRFLAFLGGKYAILRVEIRFYWGLLM